MNERQDQRPTAQDVLRHSELAARLACRLTASPGAIDLQMLRQTRSRPSRLLERRSRLLSELMARHSTEMRSLAGHQPLVMEQPWMVNLYAYLTSSSAFSSTTNQFISHETKISSASPSQSPSPASFSNQETKAVLPDTASQVSERFRIRRSPVRRAQETEPAQAEDSQRASADAVASAATTPTRLPLARMPVAQSAIQRKSPDEDAIALQAAPENDVFKEQRQPIKSAQPAMTTAAPSLIDDAANPSGERKGTSRSSLSAPQQASRSAMPSTATLPLVQKQLASSSHGPRPLDLVWRQSADALTVRDLLSAISNGSGNSFEAARQRFDAPPTLQPTESSRSVTPEAASRKGERRAGSSVATERILRHISRQLLIERERRGY